MGSIPGAANEAREGMAGRVSGGSQADGLGVLALYTGPFKSHNTLLRSALTGANTRVCSGLRSAVPYGCRCPTQGRTQTRSLTTTRPGSVRSPWSLQVYLQAFKDRMMEAAGIT